MQKTYIALDIETTSLDPEKGEVLEIGAVRFNEEKVLDEWETLVNPQEKIPTIIKAITGITEQDIKEAPTLEEVKEKIRGFVSKEPIVGHNIYFDLDFLKAKGINFPNKRYDTWRLATILLPKFPAHSLEALADYLKIKHLEKHRSLADAKASAELFLILLKEVKKIDPKVLVEIRTHLKRSRWDLADIFYD